MLDRHLWRDFASITASVAVLGIGVGSTLPLTALVLTARGAGPAVVGWMAAATAAGGVASTFACPRATALIGRRAVMLGCVSAASLSVISLQFTDSLIAWAALRAVFGAAMTPLFVIGEAWITSLPGDAVRGRVVALYTTSFTLCQLAGPLLTDAVARVPAHSFVICGAVFLLGIPGIAIAADPKPEPPPLASSIDAASRAHRAHRAHPASAASAAPKNSAASWWTIVRTAPALIAAAAFFAAFDNVILSFLPLLVLDRGATQTRALTAVMIVFLGDAALQFAAGSLADRFGTVRLHRVGGWLLCGLLPLLPAMSTVPGLWEVYLFALGGIAGSVYTLAMVSIGERFAGAALLRASGLIALTWSLASSVGPAVTGVLMQYAGAATMPILVWLMAGVFLFAAQRDTFRR